MSGLSPDAVRILVTQHSEDRQLGLLGEASCGTATHSQQVELNA